MLEEDWIGAIITQANENEDNRVCVELYDSGATCHISPYKSDFTSYAPLSPPVFLNTANQQKFPAIGHGTLIVRVPNDGAETELTLHGALHAPAVSYTLVSIATLDEEGYYAHISGGHLKLVSPQGERISCIACTQGCLYKVVHALDTANAVEPVSVMELHHFPKSESVHLQRTLEMRHILMYGDWPPSPHVKDEGISLPSQMT